MKHYETSGTAGRTPAADVPSRNSIIVLVAACLLFSALYAAFWPSSPTILDESDYLNTAAVYRAGSLYPDSVGIKVITAFSYHGHLIPKYLPGQALLLASASFCGWKAALGMNLVVHLASSIVVMVLLRSVRVSPAFALLYLFYPPAVLYSQTIMSEVPSGLLIAGAFLARLKGRNFLAGLLIGFATGVRLANGLASILFVIDAILPVGIETVPLKRRIRDAAEIFAGVIGPLVLTAYYYFIVAGGLMPNYTGTFQLAGAPSRLAMYTLALMVVFPGLLLAPLFYTGPGRRLLGLVCYSFVCLYSLWYFIPGTAPRDIFLINMRYMLTFLPLMIFAYGTNVSRAGARYPVLRAKAFQMAALILLIVTSGAAMAAHARVADEYAGIRRALIRATTPADLLICSSTVAKVFHPGLGTRNFVPEPSGMKSTIEIRSQRARHGRVVFAVWERPGRADEAAAANIVRYLALRYGARSAGLPAYPGLEIWICGP